MLFDLICSKSFHRQNVSAVLPTGFVSPVVSHPKLRGSLTAAAAWFNSCTLVCLTYREFIQSAWKLGLLCANSVQTVWETFAAETYDISTK